MIGSYTLMLTHGVPDIEAGPLDVPLSRAAAYSQRRTVKETAVGTVREASALRVSTDCGVAAPERLAGGQTPHPTPAARRRAAGATDEAEADSAWGFDWVADDGDASESRLDVGLHR